MMTYKDRKDLNLKKHHNIPIGTLVELDTGVRLFVVQHNRDCDKRPLYSLAADKEDIIPEKPGFGNDKWDMGNWEESLKIVKYSSE